MNGANWGDHTDSRGIVKRIKKEKKGWVQGGKQGGQLKEGQ